LLARPQAENTATATVTFNVGPGHALEPKVERLFVRFRAEAEALRARVDAHNQTRLSGKPERVVLYLGMCEDRPRVMESPSTLVPAGLANTHGDSDDEVELDV
jgi:hypothetical protein